MLKIHTLFMHSSKKYARREAELDVYRGNVKATSKFLFFTKFITYRSRYGSEIIRPYTPYTYFAYILSPCHIMML